jgi:tetratricopeptide (TPR) repeat protein
VVLAACSRPEPGPKRIAVLRFDNLTGDAALDWLQGAAQHVLGAELEGSSTSTPFSAETVRDASLARASQLIHGYFDRRAGKLHFQVELEDVSRNKMTAIASAGGDPIPALSAIAKTLDPSAQNFPTSNPQALEAWARGDDERAVMLDPNFGPAWFDWAQKMIAAGNPGAAQHAADLALTQTGLRSPIDRAGLQVMAASLRHDDAARASALESLAKLRPADSAPLLQLASLQMTRRLFPEAAHVYAQIALVDPGNSQATNLRGYADALAGNLDAARKDFEEYGRSPDQAINSLDSLGEAYFINGKFPEAEKEFMEAFLKDPNFLDGATAWKAAHAHWLGGDLKGADQLMQRYVQSRVTAKDPLVSWRRANWLYETGRKDMAEAALKQAPPEIAQKQLAIWNSPGTISGTPAELKTLYDQADPVNDGLVRTFYAAALMQAGQKEQAKPLLTRWPLPPADENLLQSLMYPEFLRLRDLAK